MSNFTLTQIPCHSIWYLHSLPCFHILHVANGNFHSRKHVASTWLGKQLMNCWCLVTFLTFAHWLSFTSSSCGFPDSSLPTRLMTLAAACQPLSTIPVLSSNFLFPIGPHLPQLCCLYHLPSLPITYNLTETVYLDGHFFVSPHRAATPSSHCNTCHRCPCGVVSI